MRQNAAGRKRNSTAWNTRKAYMSFQDEWLPPQFQTLRVECLRHQRIPIHKQQMAGRGIQSIGIAGNEKLLDLSVQRASIDASLPGLAASNCEEEALAIRQEHRISMRTFGGRPVQLSDARSRSARCRHTEDAFRTGAEEDHIVRAPRAATGIKSIGDRQRGSATGRNLFELPLREKSYRAAVRRPKRKLRALRALYHAGCVGVQGPQPQRGVASRRRSDENNRTTSAAGGAAERQSAVERTMEANANTAVEIQGNRFLTAGRVGTSSRSAHASPRSRKRRFGSFSRQRFNRRCALTGTPLQSGSLVNTPASVSEIVSPSNILRHVSIRTAPRRMPRYPPACRPSSRALAQATCTPRSP